jgi:hypothetical protein
MGQVVDYTFTVTNTGNTTLTVPSVVENSFSGVGAMSTPVCPDDADLLLPGQFTVCTATYIVQVADLTGAPLVNTATARAVAPGDVVVESAPSTARIDDVLDLPTGPMATSGVNLAWAWIAAAAALVMAGGALLLRRRLVVRR